jgi:hypothetical protein
MQTFNASIALMFPVDQRTERRKRNSVAHHDGLYVF